MSELLVPITVFVLAAFVGFEVITKVPPDPAHTADVGLERNLGYLDHRCDRCGRAR